MIELDEESHTYKVDKKKTPSVTTILQWSGKVPTFFFTEEGRNRGTEIHRLTEVYDITGVLEDSEYNDYVSNWIEFLELTKAKVLAVEKKVYSPEGYAGKLDRILEINGKSYVVDIKTGAKQKTHVLQIGAYSHAVGLSQGAVVCLTPKKFSVEYFDGDILYNAQQQFIQMVRDYRKENLL